MRKLLPLVIAIIGASAISYIMWPIIKPAIEPPQKTACDFSYCPQLSDRAEWTLLFGEMPSADATEWNQLFGKTFESSAEPGLTSLTYATQAYYQGACTIPMTYSSTSSSANVITVYTGAR